MGNTQAYQSPHKHQRFTEVQFSSNSTSMLVRQPLLNVAKSVEEWQEKQKLYSHIYTFNELIQPVAYQIELEGVCATSGNFVAKFQDQYVTTLGTEIENKKVNGKLFTEEELWYLLLVVARSASHVYQYGGKHFIGNIHPHHILINRRQEYRIIVTNFSWSLPDQLNHFQEYRMSGGSKSFVSPELVGFLVNTKYPQYPEYPRCVDKQAAESFCLGMTLLSMASLQNDLSKCFNNPLVRSPSKIHLTHQKSKSYLKEKLAQSPSQDKEPSLSAKKAESLNRAYLDKLLERAVNNYSQTFCELLASLLLRDPEARIKADRLYNQYLKPVQKFIETFDRKWIQVVESQPSPRQDMSG